MKKIIIFFTIVLIVISPFLYWVLKPTTELDIAVVDKTVPKKDYREHNGLFWILENKKISKPNGDLYNLSQDYFGFDPLGQKENNSYDLKGNLDLIYIADTYGVYNDDLQEIPEGERTEKIYGGMTLLEWESIMNSKDEDTTLIAEFNSFASPTEEAVRSIMEGNLSVSWTEWIGRYFKDLNSDEIPSWLIKNYETQYKEKWNFEGPGLAFVHSSDQVVVLDRNDSKKFVTLQLTSKGKKELNRVKSSNYMYWFDIIEPAIETDVLAEYKVDLSSEGEDQLKKAGIPTTFPAIIHNEKNKTYYFAGDYTDYSNNKFAKLEKIDTVFKIISHGNSEFYWSTYVPLMNEIFGGIIEEKKK